MSSKHVSLHIIGLSTLNLAMVQIIDNSVVVFWQPETATLGKASRSSVKLHYLVPGTSHVNISKKCNSEVLVGVCCFKETVIANVYRILFNQHACLGEFQLPPPPPKKKKEKETELCKIIPLWHFLGRFQSLKFGHYIH